MKHLSILFCAILTIQVSAQNAVKKYFPQHLDNQEATVVQVSGKLFQYAAHFVPQDIDDDVPVESAKEMLSNIQSFMLVKVDSLADSRKEYRLGVNKLEGQYEELIRVSDKENNVSVMIDESNDIIHEIVAVISTDNEFVVAALTGELKMDEIQKLLSKIESEKMGEILDKTDIDLEEMKVYPNPTSVESEFMIQVPQKMVGGTINVYDNTGTRVESLPATDAEMKISTSDKPAGQYYIEIQNNGVSLKKKLIVVR